VVTPRDRPRLCLLPGLDGTGRLYGPLASALAGVGVVEVLAYDSTQFHGYPALADALAPSLLRQGEVVLVAESFAGPLGVLLAHRHPECIRALVMAASFVRAPLPLSGVGAAVVEHLPAVAPPLFALERLLAGSGLRLISCSRWRRYPPPPRSAACWTGCATARATRPARGRVPASARR
jgi:pimeloyl-ACP methyl ester carboxylesterase